MSIFNLKSRPHAGSVTKCLSALAAVVILAAASVFLSACATKQEQITLADIDVYTLGSTTALTATGPNRVTSHDGKIKINVADNVEDVEVDISKFLTKHPEYLGKNFYFTRDDITKGDGTLQKGYAWVEVEPKKFKKFGSESNPSIEAKNRQEILLLTPLGTGYARMYFSLNGHKKVYLDPSIDGNLESGETNVTFRFHGNHGHVAIINITVTKAE